MSRLILILFALTLGACREGGSGTSLTPSSSVTLHLIEGPGYGCLVDEPSASNSDRDAVLYCWGSGLGLGAQPSELIRVAYSQAGPTSYFYHLTFFDTSVCFDLQNGPKPVMVGVSGPVSYCFGLAQGDPGVRDQTLMEVRPAVQMSDIPQSVTLAILPTLLAESEFDTLMATQPNGWDTTTGVTTRDLVCAVLSETQLECEGETLTVDSVEALQ